MKERAEAGSHAPAGDLAPSVRALGQRVEELSATVSALPAVAGADPQIVERVDALDLQLASMRASIERRASEPERPSDELVAMLATLRSQVEALSGLSSGATDEQLDRRMADTEDALGQLAKRIDSLATSVESATTSLGAKEQELAALHRHFTESSNRIESIVDDIREALSALPEPGSASLDDLAGRLERIEASTRKASETNARTAGELTGRIDVIDQRVAAVAAEVARAKTLWPVALRSLEARLDDAVHGHRPEPSAAAGTASTSPPDGPADDLLAGLRDSLQAMETVAAEMARASDTLGEPDDDRSMRRRAPRRRRPSRPVERPSSRYAPASPDPRCCGHSTRFSSLSAVTARGLARGWSIAPWSSWPRPSARSRVVRPGRSTP